MSTSSPSLTNSSVSSTPEVDDQVKSEFSLDTMSFAEPDPFQFLLHSMSQPAEPMDSSSSQADSPPDWSQLSAWAAASTTDNKLDLGSDFSFSLPMDLDFDPNMAVDPTALHFNTSMFSQSLSPENPYIPGPESMSHELLSASVFPIQPANHGWVPHLQTATGRRLSVTSSSSSSGASLSSIQEPSSFLSSSSRSDSSLSDGGDPAFELAQRVRQVAGVTLAVPVSAQVQQLAAAAGQAKLPIPRLPRPTPAPSSKRSTPKSSPSPEPSCSTSSDSSAANSQASDTAPPATTSSGRPKTSHTTIERRYRTNLNARITGLKQAVPALRVLEAKNGNLFHDVVDERGFVDGVKVARKMSKANVLGKATEYIKVLKRREFRLKREQDGLKSLLHGLVGGPALLKEWEREWKDKFGGEEKDEIEDDGVGAASDDEDGDGEDSDGEDGEEGRARKKAKVAKAPKKEKAPRPAPAPVVSTAPGVVPEKRKRGRPRKIPLPPTVPAPPPIIPENTSIVLSDQFMQQDSSAKAEGNAQPAQQYLLAAFAFFSVFNSPLTSSYTRAHSSTHAHQHAHHGTVLTDSVSMTPATSVPVPAAPWAVHGYGLHELTQAFHLLVSTLVFFYVILPWLSGALRQNRFASTIISKLSKHSSRSHAQPRPFAVASSSSSEVVESPKVETSSSQMLMDALSLSRRGSADEATQLRAALGVSTGLVGLMQGVIKASRNDKGIEFNQLEQRAWVRLGEVVAFDDSVSRITRLQTFWCMSWHLPTFATSTTDLSTLALIIRPVSHSKATALWQRARSRDILRAHEKIVLSNMNVDTAAEWLAKWRQWHETERKGRCAACEKRTPLGVLAAILIRERLRKHAAAMFVRTVLPNGTCEEAGACDNDAMVYDAEQDMKDEQERRETIEAGKSIGGRTAELAILLERIWDTGFCAHEDVLPSPRSSASARSPDEGLDCEDEHDLASTDEAEIRSLLSATLIHRRIFPSSFPTCGPSVSVILSPPPSPSRRNIALHVALRTALGSPAFDYNCGRMDDEKLGEALEDARDRVVDMLVELERAGRRNGRY